MVRFVIERLQSKAEKLRCQVSQLQLHHWCQEWLSSLSFLFILKLNMNLRQAAGGRPVCVRLNTQKQLRQLYHADFRAHFAAEWKWRVGKDGWVFGHSDHLTKLHFGTFQHARRRQTVFCQPMNGCDHVELMASTRLTKWMQKKNKKNRSVDGSSLLLGDSRAMMEGWVDGWVGAFYPMYAVKMLCSESTVNHWLLVALLSQSCHKMTAI